MDIKQNEIFICKLDPTTGHEIKKTRPCVILSPDVMNSRLKTVIVAPLMNSERKIPTRVKCSVGGKSSWIVLDQIRTLDKSRCIRKRGKLSPQKVRLVKVTLKKILLD